ncbi:MAG: hypothetical protein JXQ75_09495 [Phycisphaerae bacterium]|nr:hypothetical protein [Phycisphaerae bacterium]
MVLRTRKLVVVGVIAAVLLLANALVIATWLNSAGVIRLAKSLRAEYVTGTAIVVIAALLILLPAQRRERQEARFSSQQCPVCDERLRPGGRYCPACGSLVTR